MAHRCNIVAAVATLASAVRHSATTRNEFMRVGRSATEQAHSPSRLPVDVPSRDRGQLADASLSPAAQIRSFRGNSFLPPLLYRVFPVPHGHLLLFCISQSPYLPTGRPSYRLGGRPVLGRAALKPCKTTNPSTVVMPSSSRADETIRGRRPCPSHGAPPSSCPSTARPARAYSSSGRVRGRLQARSRG